MNDSGDHMGSIQYKNFDQLGLADMLIYDAIPPHPFWSRVNEVVDFSFIDKVCEPLYSPRGQRPYAPSLKLRIHMVQRYYNISDREMERRIICDLDVKRFLGLPVTHNKFDHSTIGLDRTRLGAEMMHVCHVYILAQALEKGLWGQDDDRWLVDAFHTNARVSKPGVYELIQQAAANVLRHVEKKNPQRYMALKKEMDLNEFTHKLKHSTPRKQRNLALSRLVVCAYGLVAWMSRQEEENQCPWGSEVDLQKSEQHCEVLRRVLNENMQPVPPDGDDGTKETTDTSEPNQGADEQSSGTTESERLQYVEQPSKSKPTDRIVNVYDPEIRVGHKTRRLSFIGDKVQVVESWKSKLVLLAEPIVGNEADGERLFDLVQSVVEEYGTRPKEVVADQGYAWGRNFQRMKSKHLVLIAPPPKPNNPTGKIPNSQFTYDPKNKTVTCPQGHQSVSSTYIKASEGTQYKFDKAQCGQCPLKDQCVSSKAKKSTVGRTVFVSDYWELHQNVREILATVAGKTAMKTRQEVERTNHEMKRHHGLREPRTRGRQNLRTTVKLTCMVVNLKRMVKALATDPPATNKAPVCA